MDWLTGIQNAINYIEDHLTEEIDFAAAAREAACSPFYLQRIFSLLCGMTMGDYIRSRRLSLAGDELSTTGCRVGDIAAKYGYESPESFARAFSRFHGITPTEARRDGSNLKYFFRLSVKIALRGGAAMNYKIVEQDAIDIIERPEVQKRDDAVSIPSIQEYWARAHRSGMVRKLFDLSPDKSKIFGICYGNLSTTPGFFEYAIAAAADKSTPLPEGFRRSRLPARTWAVFECRGPIPDAMQEMWEMIVSEFFPTSGYQPTYEMDVEAYPPGDRSRADYCSEIWVPVIKKI